MRAYSVLSMVYKKIFLLFLCFSLLGYSPLNAQELREEVKQEIPVVSGFLYGLQRYTGFNLFFDFLTETVVETIIKLTFLN